MSGNGPIFGGTLGKFLNPGREAVRAVTPDSWNKYTDVLTEGALDPGGAWRDASKLAAGDPGTPPALEAAPNPDNSAAQLDASSALQRKAKGRASTILSTGATEDTPTARRTLLGI